MVRAVSRYEIEDRNEEFQKATIPDQGPPLFKGVKAAVNVAGKVQLNWDAPLGQTSKFRIFQAQGSASAIDFTKPLSVFELGSSTTTLLSGFQANKAYTFVVRAEDQNGNVDGNTQAVTLVAGQQSLPEFAGYVSVLPLREGEIKAEWLTSAGGNVKNYHVSWRKVGITNWSTASVLHSVVGTLSYKRSVCGPSTILQTSRRTTRYAPYRQPTKRLPNSRERPKRCSRPARARSRCLGPYGRRATSRNFGSTGRNSTS